MNKLCFSFLLMLISFPTAFADEIIMSIDQSEYYFRTGENAVIPVEIQNDYGHQISGILKYTITQQINQGNTQFSSSNTQSSTFVINNGTQIISLDFGTSNSPLILTITLNFIYTDDTQINIFFDPIIIHFVADESQKNNIQNPLQSSSQRGSTSQNNPSNPQQSLQEKLNELMNQQSPFSQDPQQRLQNNQLAQDSSALKKEIQAQLQEENSLKKAFENELASNDDFQNSHQQLLQQGYNVTDGSLDPISAKTGDFEVNYQNNQGKWAKVQGSMLNGTMSEIKKQTQEEIENLLEQLKADLKFRQYDEQLRTENFFEQNMEFIYDSNKTTIQLQYNNEDNQIATIFGEFESGNLENVFLEKPNEDSFSWIFMVSILFVAIISYLLYRLFRRNKKEHISIINQKTISQSYDHTITVEKLIQEGKEHFANSNQKDAYGKINQALRLFLSHELNLKKETTNEHILEHILQENYPVSDIEECFRIASLVEFAKYVPNSDDFSRVVSIIENLVYEKSK